MLRCSPMPTYTFDNIAVVVVPAADATATLPIPEGEWDWWFGQIADEWWAYVITTEDADGNVASPDWPELPELLKSHIMAGLRGEVPA